MGFVVMFMAVLMRGVFGGVRTGGMARAKNAKAGHVDEAT